MVQHHGMNHAGHQRLFRRQLLGFLARLPGDVDQNVLWVAELLECDLAGLTGIDSELPFRRCAGVAQG